MRYSSLVCLAALILAAPVQAQDKEAPDDFVTIGVGAGALPDYEGSNDYIFLPVPGAMGSIKGYSFLLLGNQLSVDLIRDKGGPSWDFQLGPEVSINFIRANHKGIHEASISALTPVGTSVKVGGYAGIAKQGVITSDYDRFSVTVGIDHDVTAYNGTTVTPAISYMTPLSKSAMVAFNITAVHADSRYADAYFSINPADSIASGLPQFTAHGGWKNWSVGGATAVSLTGDLRHGLAVVGGAMYTRLLNDFAASPVTSIAGSRNQWLAALGLAYTF